MTTELIPKEESTAVEFIEKTFGGFDNYAVECIGDLEVAADWLSAIKAKYKELEEKRKSLTKPLDESKKRIMDFFRRPLEVLDRAERGIKKGVTAWHEAQERRREEDNRRIAEQARLEAERAAADIAARAAEAAAWGDEQSAAEIVAEPPVVMAPKSIREQKTPVAGLTLRDNWKGQVVDFPAFARWCVEQGEFGLLMPDQSAVNYRAKGTKGKVFIPGVRWFNDRGLQSRA